MYSLRVPDQVVELVRTLHPDLKKKVRASLKIILSAPDSGKALKEELAGVRSFRVGRFRIIYRVRKKEIEIVAVGPRARIYEATYRIIRKAQP